MNNKQIIGSNTAKGGFENEDNIFVKFNNYKTDFEAQIWLKIMGYDWERIKSLKASKIPASINKSKALELGASEDKIVETIKFKKADIQIKLEILVDDIYYIENLSLKKATIGANFNQIDKRSVTTYQNMWGFNDSIAQTLKLFTGEIKPTKSITGNLLDSRRMYLNEIKKSQVKELLTFFNENKTLIFTDILKGRGTLSADWFLVTRKNKEGDIDWILKDINFVCNFFAQGNVEVSNRGGLKIGRITAQRKGGTPDPKSLQFKINPLDLFINE